MVSWSNSHSPKDKAMDGHSLVIWCNLTTVGVMPAAKFDFFITAVSNLLATHKRNAIALIVHCNRASDTGRTQELKLETTTLLTLF